MAFIEVMKATLFRNRDRFNGDQPMERGKPNFGNGKITLHTAIPPGEYTISGWQYSDTMNIGITMSRREEALDQRQPAPDGDPDYTQQTQFNPGTDNQPTDGFDDFR